MLVAPKKKKKKNYNMGALYNMCPCTGSEYMDNIPMKLRRKL